MSTLAPNAAAVAERDQILAVLREAERPMTAQEIGGLLVHVKVTPCGGHGRVGCAGVRRRTWRHFGEHLGDGLDVWTSRGVHSWSLWPQLVALHEAGLVERGRAGRKVLWRLGPGCGRAGS